MNSERLSKSEIRKVMLARRDALDARWRIDASLLLPNYADALSIKTADIVSGFFPIRSEIDPRPLMGHLADKGVRLCLPVVLDKETIVFREFVAGQQQVPTGFGTLGPDNEALVLDPTVLLIPLAAFDNSGNRVGYGAGYYDRAIARLHASGLSPRLIGVAFETQRVPLIPAEPYDVPLHMVLTENGLQNLAV